jgi:hypothetical protein
MEIKDEKKEKREMLSGLEEDIGEKKRKIRKVVEEGENGDVDKEYEVE